MSISLGVKIPSVRILPTACTSFQIMKSSRNVIEAVLKACINKRLAADYDPYDVRRVVVDAASVFDKIPGTFIGQGEFCVVGDIHGDIDTLLRIFEKNRYPPETKYIFLGDYVDRGHNSTEVILFLYALSVQFPEHVILLRGNHEFEQMCVDFKRECTAKLGQEICAMIIATFDKLPIAAVVGNNFLAHAGVSPTAKTALDVWNIPKVAQKEVSLDDPVMDILWSDPSPYVDGFVFNTARGAGKFYSEEGLVECLSRCGLSRIIRGHESCTYGHDWAFGKMGPVLTVFSTCDYCMRANSAASVIISSEDGRAEITTYAPLQTEQQAKRRVSAPEWFMIQTAKLLPVTTQLHIDASLDVVLV